MIPLLCLCLVLAAEPTGTHRVWSVDSVKREALIFAPSKKSAKAPVVFAFHGHGGTMRNSANRFNYQEHWPEAVVVYMQGLPTPGRTDPDGKRPGWQKTVGDQSDRDLKFFDAVLATLKKEHALDENRVYATGHSNGGGFTYLLWAARGEQFAAFAPSSCGGGRLLKDAKPKPVLHVAGEKDPVVSFENQKVTMDLVKKLNGCEETGKPLAKGCTLYSSKLGCPVVTCIHPGDHTFPAAAPKVIVKFFQEHVRK